MAFVHWTLPSLLLTVAPPFAQQVKYIDLISTTQRVELRFPPPMPGQNGGYGGGLIGDCGLDAREPRSLTVSLQSVISRDSDPQRPIEAEFKVLNTGQVPLELPVSPHLADLQPNDASAPFNYMSIALSVSPAEDRSIIGFIELYGKKDVAGTMMILNPGEWLRVDANVKFSSKPLPSGLFNMVSGYWLTRATFDPHPSGYSTVRQGICLKSEPTPSIPVTRN